MKQWIKALNDQAEKFRHLESKREQNKKMIHNRIKEIEEEKQRKKSG